MKKVLLIVAVISMIGCKNNSNKVVQVKNPYFKKELIKTMGGQMDTTINELPKYEYQYSITDSIEVKDGKDEKVKVKFTAIVDTVFWNTYKSGRSDTSALDWLAYNITLEAKHGCKNRISFTPLKNQTIFISGKNFVCNYKLICANGFGIKTELEALIYWNPNEYK